MRKSSLAFGIAVSAVLLAVICGRFLLRKDGRNSYLSNARKTHASWSTNTFVPCQTISEVNSILTRTPALGLQSLTQAQREKLYESLSNWLWSYMGGDIDSFMKTRLGGAHHVNQSLLSNHLVTIIPRSIWPSFTNQMLSADFPNIKPRFTADTLPTDEPTLLNAYFGERSAGAFGNFIEAISPARSKIVVYRRSDDSIFDNFSGRPAFDLSRLKEPNEDMIGYSFCCNPTVVDYDSTFADERKSTIGVVVAEFKVLAKNVAPDYYTLAFLRFYWDSKSLSWNLSALVDGGVLRNTSKQLVL